MELINVNCLLTILELLEKRSYTTKFEVRGAVLVSLRTKHRFLVGEVDLVQSYQFKNHFDSNERSFLYVLETKDHEKGTLSNGYKTSSDLATSSFVHKLIQTSK